MVVRRLRVVIVVDAMIIRNFGCSTSGRGGGSRESGSGCGRMVSRCRSTRNLDFAVVEKVEVSAEDVLVV